MSILNKHRFFRQHYSISKDSKSISKSFFVRINESEGLYFSGKSLPLHQK
jgi:hypothetical protein